MTTIARYTDQLKQFVTHASHELKTPLMTISSSIDLMIKQGVDSSQTQTIKQTTTAMKQLIDRLMMTMRDDVPQAHKLDIVQLISHTIKRSESIHPHCQGRLIASVDEGLIKYTDLVMCESIISNLIENACKYATLDTPITITADQTQLSVANHVDPDLVVDLEQIWQPFYQ
jgi:signal transduction histidine kinase